MRKTITMLALTGLLSSAHPAAAAEWGNYDNIRAWVAESMQWRLSYLPKVYQKGDVFGLPGFGFQGAATLVRSRNGIEGSIMTNVAEAGAAYTLWIMVINNPGACTATPCAEADLFNPDTETSAYNGGGAISASNGNGGGVININYATTAGPLPDGLFALFGDVPGVHRGNGLSAEVWLIVDSHNPMLDDSGSWVADLTTTDFLPGRNHRVAQFVAVE